MNLQWNHNHNHNHKHLQSLVCNSTIKNYLKTKKEFSWFACRETLGCTDRRLRSVLVCPTWNEKAKFCCREIWEQRCPLLHSGGGGAENIHDAHNITRVKSRNCETHSAPGVWTRAERPRASRAMRRPSQSGGTGKRLEAKVNQAMDGINVMTKGTHVSITDGKKKKKKQRALLPGEPTAMLSH